MDTLFKDLHYALRRLRGSPGFTAPAVLTQAPAACQPPDTRRQKPGGSYVVAVDRVRRCGALFPLNQERLMRIFAPNRAAVRAMIVAVTLSAVACDGLDPVYCESSVIEEISFSPDGPHTVERLRDGQLVEARIRDTCSRQLTPSSGVEWSSSDPSVVEVRPLDVASSAPPMVFAEAKDFGSAQVSISYRSHQAEFEVEVVRPETEAVGFTVLDSGEVGARTTDLWVYGDFAYSGSNPWRCVECGESWLFVWQLGADGSLQAADSLSLPARRIDDVKISADGSFAVATMGSVDVGENGIALLDLSNPAAPTVVTRYNEGLEQGVQNVWIERIQGTDYVFAVEVGSDEVAGVHVLDVSNLSAPSEVALFHAGSSIPHDVYVRNGLAFVSHGNAGLVILDVGNGVADGSPSDPVEVGRVETEQGNVYNAWYWPERELVFVGEQRFPPPDQLDDVGQLRVVDVSDLSEPVVVANLGVPGASPHNFWLDEEAEVLFAAWYENGLRAIDVSGTLSGDLAVQGLELGHLIPSGHRGGASVRAPQLHEGVLYLSDIFNGVWAVQFDG